MNEKIELLKELYLNNKLSHVILIETNNQNFCIEELKNLVKIMSCENINDDNHNNCSLCNMIDMNESMNFFLIEPNGKNIKKEQMIELRTKCSKLPILSKNNIYIIKNAEKFNNSSANTILKFIEEPYENCYGFFVVNSKENMINTIKSRCEIYNVRYDSGSFLESNNITDLEYQEIKENIRLYLSSINKDIIVNKEILIDSYKTKENVEKYFRIMLDIIDNYIDLSLEKTDSGKYNEFNFLKTYKLTNLMKKKALIINILNNMSYNLNIDLIFDKFVIEMGEINE